MNTDRSRYRGSFELCTYVVVRDIERFFAGEHMLRNVTGTLHRMGVAHVVLEVYRGGVEAADAALQRARDVLQGAGFRVSGGLTTTCGEGVGRPEIPQRKRFCYSRPESMEALARLSRKAARLFDQLVLDDFFFTRCECEDCRSARGGRPWRVFRTELLRKVARDGILTPGRAENPACRFVIKFPQWYDRFERFGYDVPSGAEAFDAVWVGTETRDPHNRLRYSVVQQAESWVVYDWVESMAGGKTEAAWFDPIGCDRESYVEQAFQTVLTGTPEMVLFNYGSVFESARVAPLREAFEEQLPRLRQWAEALSGARPCGLACVRPPGMQAQWEPYVFDYLAMIGVPVTLHPDLPDNAQAIFLPEHAATLPRIGSRVRERLRDGASIVVTTSFLAQLNDAELARDVFGVVLKRKTGPVSVTRVYDSDTFHILPMALAMRGTIAEAGASAILVCGDEEVQLPFLTRSAYGNGYAGVLDTVTAPVEFDALHVDRWIGLMELPEPVLNRLRAELLAVQGLAIEGPGRVGVYTFDGGTVAVCNYRNVSVTMRIGCRERRGAGEKISSRCAPAEWIAVELAPRSRILIPGNAPAERL